MVRFNLTSPLLLTIALAGPVRPADKRHLAEKKSKLIFKKPESSLLVIIIKCGTHSNIIVLNNLIVFF